MPSSNSSIFETANRARRCPRRFATAISTRRSQRRARLAVSNIEELLLGIVVSYLCQGSDDVCRALRKARVTPSTTFLKFDVVDFYLSGSHEQIVDAVTEFVPEKHEKKFLRYALPIVLQNQFVENSLDEKMSTDTVHQVCCGSGIGLRHSGAVADASMACLVEQDLQWAFALGVEVFLRFRDDVFVAAKNPQCARAFIQEYQRRAACFCEVKLESTSVVVVTFLDMKVSKTPNGRLEFSPYVKKSARHLPLGGDSYHPPGVHSSWPVSECRRMLRRSSSAKDGLEWAMFKIGRFRHYGVQEHVLRKCHEELNSVPSSVARNFLESLVGPSEGFPEKIVRLVLPYHHKLLRLPVELREFTQAWQDVFTSMLGIKLLIRGTWSQGGTPLMFWVRSRR